MTDLHKQEFSSILIARKIFGFWFEFWQVQREMRDESTKLIHRTRDHYLSQWGKGNVRLRLHYPDYIIEF